MFKPWLDVSSQACTGPRVGSAYVWGISYLVAPCWVVAVWEPMVWRDNYNGVGFHLRHQLAVRESKGYSKPQRWIWVGRSPPRNKLADSTVPQCWRPLCKNRVFGWTMSPTWNGKKCTRKRLFFKIFWESTPIPALSAASVAWSHSRVLLAPAFPTAPKVIIFWVPRCSASSCVIRRVQLSTRWNRTLWSYCHIRQI